MLTSPLNLPAPGRRQCLYVVLSDLAGTCVFTKQSLGSILCGPLRLAPQEAHLPRAPLLPKLRGHFAEFLDRDSLERLRLLASPTCVGLRYGHPSDSHARLFSAVGSRPLCEARSLFGIGSRFKGRDLPHPFSLHPYIGTSITRRALRSGVPPRAQSPDVWRRNIHPLPIDYASRPRLRDRLTLS